MDTSKIFKHAADCIPEHMGEDLLVYRPQCATTLHLNGSSAIVWGLCTGEHSVEEMIEAVSEAFPEQAGQIRADIVDVIDDLIERNFLVEVVN